MKLRAEKLWDKERKRDVIRIFTGAEQPNEDGIKEYITDYIFDHGKVANVGELEEIVNRINKPNIGYHDVEKYYKDEETK